MGLMGPLRTCVLLACPGSLEAPAHYAGARWHGLCQALHCNGQQDSHGTDSRHYSLYTIACDWLLDLVDSSGARPELHTPGLDMCCHQSLPGTGYRQQAVPEGQRARASSTAVMESSAPARRLGKTRRRSAGLHRQQAPAA